MRVRLSYTGRGLAVNPVVSSAASSPGDLVVHSACWPTEIDLPERASLEELLAALRERAIPLAPACLIIVNGKHLGTLTRPIPTFLEPDDEILFLAPVAGG